MRFPSIDPATGRLRPEHVPAPDMSGVMRDRGALSTSSPSLDTLYGQADAGVYRVTLVGTASALALPSISAGVLRVSWLSGASSVEAMQEWVPASGPVWRRRRNPASGAWTAWAVDTASTVEVASGMSFAGLHAPGLFRVTSATAGSVTGHPGGAGVLVGMSSTGVTTATVRMWLGIDGSLWLSGIAPATNTYSAWRRVFPAEVAAGVDARRLSVVESRGGRIGTAGRGVVAFRFDHNLDPLRSTVLPMLEARGFPASVAHYVEQQAPTYTTAEESSGTTWQQAQDLHVQHGVEAWSHGWTHTDASTEALLRKEIVDARAELEALMPQVRLAGWMQPGFVGTKYMGHGDAWGGGFSTVAGNMIDATFGVTDRPGGALTPLGSRRFGSVSIDAATVPDAVNSLVTNAAESGHGLVVMLHPNRLDKAGGVSSATLTSIMDHVATLREQGMIDVLTVAGLLCADPGSSWRHSLTPPITSPRWSGWTLTGGKRVGSATPLACVVSLAHLGWTKGYVRQLVVEAEGAGDVMVRVVDPAVGGSGLDTSTTATISGSGTMRRAFGVPRAATSIRVEITQLSGSVQVTSAAVNAV